MVRLDLWHNSAMSFERAVELVQEGRVHEAEKLLRDRIALTRGDSIDRTRAWYELGGLLHGLGDYERAADSMQAALEVTARDRDHEQLKLTVAWNLGTLLIKLGRLDDAHALAVDSLSARGAFYGKEHPGYGYGLEGLAEVQLARGELASALEAIEAAVDLFVKTENPRVIQALALRAPICAANDEPAFYIAAKLADATFEQVVREVADDERAAPAVRVEVLDELIERVAERPKLTHWLPRLYMLLSNAALEAGPDAHPQRIAALQALRELFEEDPHQTIGVLLALALAEDQGANVEAADRYYREALQHADALDEPAARARVNRNFGLFLAQRDQVAEGKQRLAAALAAARLSSDREEVGSCAIAYGMTLQHAGDAAAAEPLLEEGIGLLPAENADAVCARNHLTAIRTKAECGCGDPSTGLGQALLELIHRTVPADLVLAVDVKLPAQGGPPQVGIQLAREPNDEERQLLESAVNLALATLRSGIAKRGLAPVG